jgi:DNA-binding transcriptional ArsR family regulator
VTDVATSLEHSPEPAGLSTADEPPPRHTPPLHALTAHLDDLSRAYAVDKVPLPVLALQYGYEPDDLRRFLNRHGIRRWERVTPPEHDLIRALGARGMKPAMIARQTGVSEPAVRWHLDHPTQRRAGSQDESHRNPRASGPARRTPLHPLTAYLDDLSRAYAVEKVPLPVLALQYGYEPVDLRRFLNRHGIRRQRRVTPAEHDLIRALGARGMKPPVIARRTGLSEPTVRRHLDHPTQQRAGPPGVGRRGLRGAGTSLSHGRAHPLDVYLDELSRAYVVKRVPLPVLARQYEYSSKALRQFLNRRGIRRRPHVTAAEHAKILALGVSGLAVRAIAAQMDVSESTVRRHLKHPTQQRPGRP